MKTMLYIVAGLFVCSVFVEMTLSKLKQRTANQLISQLMQKDFDAFDAMIHKKRTKFFVPVFNSLMLQFHKAVMQEHKKEAEQLIEKLQQVKKDKQQEIFFYSKAFSYYITRKDKKNIEMYYQLISGCEDSLSKSYVEMVYNTLIQHGFRYIQEAEQLLEEATGEDKQNILMLLSQMYENQRKHVHAEACGERIVKGDL
ncbi:MAG: hypothetical protein ACLTW1_09025 [[Clostridium] innocuum]